MSFLSSLNISGSALTAQRFRMDIIAQNIANSNTTRTTEGGPYRRKLVVFEERQSQTFGNVFANSLASYNNDTDTDNGGGVRVREVIEDDTPFTPVYNPSHPDADENGYVMMPNVDTTKEMLDLMAASSAYDANLTALNAIKAMAVSALNIGR
ncbi:MAG: flagellar basal body rod protein FlgC [Acetanaerobacterium sp.]